MSMYRPPFPEQMRPAPEQVPDTDRFALWRTAERTASSSKKLVGCYSGLKLFARYMGHATAWVGTSCHGRLLRPENPDPSIEEEAETLAVEFREGVEETLRAQARQQR